MREEDPRTFDDKDKLEEQYKKYRASFFHKNNRSFFDEVKEMNWCKEKYGLAEELVEQRKALRSKGREGRLDTFAQSLENGEFDDLTFEGKRESNTQILYKLRIAMRPGPTYSDQSTPFFSSCRPLTRQTQRQTRCYRTAYRGQ